jgi:hypothetical protein
MFITLAELEASLNSAIQSRKEADIIFMLDMHLLVFLQTKDQELHGHTLLRLTIGD